MRIIVRNVNIVRNSRTELMMNVVMEHGIIQTVTEEVPAADAELVFDGTGMWILPAFADMHFRFEAKGETRRADLLPGALRGAEGGYTDVCCMPNTSPPIDSVALIHDVLKIARGAAATIRPIAAITHEMKGQRLTHFSRLKEAGAVAFSDNGSPVASMKLMIEAMEMSQKTGSVIMVHEGNTRVVAEDGRTDTMLSRDLYIAEHNGGRLHLCGVSEGSSIASVAAAKKRCPGRITCDVSQLDFIDERGLPPNVVPRRSKQDVVKALIDGTIDAITPAHASDIDSPDRTSGLEAAFSDAVTYLYQPGLLPVWRIAELMSSNPRGILGLSGGNITAGAPADVVICDLDTPFRRNGRYAFGKVIMTVKGGEVTFAAGEHESSRE